jgi:splicing factor 1
MADLAAKIAAKARAAAAKMSELQGVGSHHPVTQAVDWNRPLNREAPEASDLIMPMMLPDTAVSNDGAPSTSKHSGVNGALLPVSGKDAHAAAHPQVTLAEYREQVLVAEAKKRKRREGSKWAPTRLEDDEEAKRGRLLAYKTRIDALSTMMESPVPIGRRLPPPGARSPSPPPEYDKSTGQRVNTREQRVYDAWDTERREAVGKALEMDPLYKPPIGHRPLVHELRLYIPHKEHPGYNFMGLIIGPRGNTQKRLERETGAHIRVRGKEMQKEGRSLPPQFPGQDDGRDDELHVHISADSIEKVDRAARMIHPLLTPLDPDQNPHKQKQLRELAELNGTVCDVGKLERARLLQEEDAKHDYKLSKDLQSKVDSMYAKDVATKLAADGKGVGDSAPNDGMDDEYENFLSELTGNLIGEGAVPGHGSKRAPAASNPRRRRSRGGGEKPVGDASFSRRIGGGGGGEREHGGDVPVGARVGARRGSRAPPPGRGASRACHAAARGSRSRDGVRDRSIRRGPRDGSYTVHAGDRREARVEGSVRRGYRCGGGGG